MLQKVTQSNGTYGERIYLDNLEMLVDIVVETGIPYMIFVSIYIY